MTAAWDEPRRIAAPYETFLLGLAERQGRTVFRLATVSGRALMADAVLLETIRACGTRQIFTFADSGDALHSGEPVRRPYDFTANLRIGDTVYSLAFEDPGDVGGGAPGGAVKRVLARLWRRSSAGAKR